MRWLMICLLVSLGAMLLAAAGVARHIWLQRSKLHSNPDAGPAGNPALNTVEEADPEIET